MDRQYLDDVPKEVQDLLYDGKKIEAIKLTKEELGLDLKDAKERVEKISATMEEQFPGVLPKAQGCAGMVLLGLSLLGATSYGVVHVFC